MNNQDGIYLTSFNSHFCSAKAVVYSSVDIADMFIVKVYVYTSPLYTHDYVVEQINTRVFYNMKNAHIFAMKSVRGFQ